MDERKMRIAVKNNSRSSSIEQRSVVKTVPARLEESIREYQERKVLRRSVYRFAGAWMALVFAMSAAIVLLTDGSLGRDIFLWSLPPVFLVVLFIQLNLSLFRKPSMEKTDRLGVANILTILRIFLIPVFLVLFFSGYLMPGLIVYLLAALTDVADGFLARRLKQETAFGLMVDPVGDILSTLAVFSYLLIEGDIPIWLFIILVLRYIEFFVGLGLLFVLGRMPVLRATISGKLVGTVQAIGIIILLAGKIFPGAIHPEETGRYLFPLLGAAFAAVIISQTVIGYRALRRNAKARR